MPPWLIELLADGTLVVILLVSAPIIIGSLRKTWRTHTSVVIMAGLTSLLIGKLMSLLYQPEFARPFLELGVTPGATYINNPGFPSDHALLATMVVGTVFMLTRNRPLTVMLASLVALMCLGRVLALVHTPLDVVGGVVAGLSGLIWYKKLTK